ncbi:MAG: hypothetical protein J1F06_05240, partial [Prevotellaceae bacterium]|nr:hypothetical protein [Prevotellaceae bacterium]
WKYICISELRLYEATADPKSPINNVAPAVVDELKAQIAAAQAQLAAGAATREQIEALQAALDAFVAQCPDPALLLAAVADAKAVVNGAPVGEGLGYYPQSAVDAFNAVIAAVEATYASDMSLALISEGRAKLAEATMTFRLSLTMPEAGKIYTIKSGTSSEATGAAGGGLLRAQNNSRTAAVQWTKESVDPSVDLYCVWEVVKAEGFNLTLRNAGTGLYLNDQDGLSVGVTLTDSVNAREVTSANEGGMFNIRISSAGAEQTKYLNAQPTSNADQTTTGAIVAWTSAATGADNGAFIFEEATLSRYGESEIKVAANQLQIISLPYAILADGNMYAVAGANAEATEVYANSIDGETIPAGAAFIYNETAGATTAFVYPADEFPFAYSQENKLANGLQAVLEGGQIPVGVGYFQGASPYISTPQLHSVGANSGYIPVSVTENVISGGDLTIKFSQGASLNGIGTIEAGVAGAGKIYDLSGRRVEKAQKGLYIVDGKKVLVK